MVAMETFHPGRLRSVSTLSVAFLVPLSSALVTQLSFRAVGQTHVKWQTFEKPENKRQIYSVSRPMPDCHAFVSYFRVFQMSTILHVFGLQL